MSSSNKASITTKKRNSYLIPSLLAVSMLSACGTSTEDSKGEPTATPTVAPIPTVSPSPTMMPSVLPSPSPVPTSIHTQSPSPSPSPISTEHPDPVGLTSVYNNVASENNAYFVRTVFDENPTNLYASDVYVSNIQGLQNSIIPATQEEVDARNTLTDSIRAQQSALLSAAGAESQTDFKVTDDTARLQAALNAASQEDSGGVVQLRPSYLEIDGEKNYRFRVGRIDMPSNVRLEVHPDVIIEMLGDAERAVGGNGTKINPNSTIDTGIMLFAVGRSSHPSTLLTQRTTNVEITSLIPGEKFTIDSKTNFPLYYGPWGDKTVKQSIAERASRPVAFYYAENFRVADAKIISNHSEGVGVQMFADSNYKDGVTNRALNDKNGTPEAHIFLNEDGSPISSTTDACRGEAESNANANLTGRYFFNNTPQCSALGLTAKQNSWTDAGVKYWQQGELTNADGDVYTLAELNPSAAGLNDGILKRNETWGRTPKQGIIKNIRMENAHTGYGAVQSYGSDWVLIEDIEVTNGVAVRIEAGNGAITDNTNRAGPYLSSSNNIEVRNVTLRNGFTAVWLKAHSKINTNIVVENVKAIDSATAVLVGKSHMSDRAREYINGHFENTIIKGDIVLERTEENLGQATAEVGYAITFFMSEAERAPYVVQQNAEHADFISSSGFVYDRNRFWVDAVDGNEPNVQEWETALTDAGYTLPTKERRKISEGVFEDIPYVLRDFGDLISKVDGKVTAADLPANLSGKRWYLMQPVAPMVVSAQYDSVDGLTQGSEEYNMALGDQNPDPKVAAYPANALYPRWTKGGYFTVDFSQAVFERIEPDGATPLRNEMVLFNKDSKNLSGGRSNQL